MNETPRRFDRSAGLYDAAMWPLERLLLARWRSRLWSNVPGGRLLEIGVGTGINLPYYPGAARAVAIDFSAAMLAQAVGKARGGGVDFALADATHLPFKDSAFDTVVATFVSCSAADPVPGLREASRVVAAEGRVLLLEHGRGILGPLMDGLNRLTARGGEYINHDVTGSVRAAGMVVRQEKSHFLGIVKQIKAGKPSQ